MFKGTVKFFNHSKGFGFIRVTETGQEIYVKNSGLIDSIKDGDQVQFEINEAKKGPIATQVSLLQEDS